jgi:hypothetical protein
MSDLNSKQEEDIRNQYREMLEFTLLSKYCDVCMSLIASYRCEDREAGAGLYLCEDCNATHILPEKYQISNVNKIQEINNELKKLYERKYKL